jgi:sugar transferase (PEP-CTERM system associated)
LSKPHLGYKVEGFIDDNPDLLGVSIVNPRVIGLHEDMPKIVSERKVNKIIVELQDRRGRLPTQSLLQLKTKGIDIEDATSFYERITGKIAIENLKPSWLIFNTGFDSTRRTILLKITYEIAVSAALLILLSPVILMIMLAIRLDSPGPIFHRQQRVGKDGKIFTIWKFRSMYQDAETRTGPVWAEKNDPRITRVGRVLRCTRLDEVPQLFNVFSGEMSLVGPRPERPEFVSQLQESIPYYPLRHSVKPGVTGWAQINNGYANSVENTIEKLQFDLFYIKNMSLQLDMVIILETVKTCLTLRGV